MPIELLGNLSECNDLFSDLPKTRKNKKHQKGKHKEGRKERRKEGRKEGGKEGGREGGKQGGTMLIATTRSCAAQRVRTFM